MLQNRRTFIFLMRQLGGQDMKIRDIKRFEGLEKVHSKYIIYCDVKKCIMVENLDEGDAGGPYYYASDGRLTEIFGYAKRDSREKLLIEYVSFDSLIPGDFFVCDSDVYCTIRWKGKISAQICKYDQKVRRFRPDVIVGRIRIASQVPDSFFDKAYNFIEKILR